MRCWNSSQSVLSKYKCCGHGTNVIGTELFVDPELHIDPSSDPFGEHRVASPGLISLFTTQFSSQSETPDSREQLQQALEERAQLETRVEQVRLCRGWCGRGG